MPFDSIMLGGAWQASGWATEGILTNPGASVVLADTGELPEGVYSFTYIFSINGQSNVWVALEHRNAANGATLYSQAFWMGGWNVIHYGHIPQYQMGDEERMRFFSIGNLQGQVQYSIIWFRHYS